MSIHNTACMLLGQTKIGDTPLRKWVNSLIADHNLIKSYPEWQVNVTLSKRQQRSDIAVYNLASELVWYRIGECLNENKLGQELAKFHMKILEIEKAGVRKRAYLARAHRRR